MFFIKFKVVLVIASLYLMLPLESVDGQLSGCSSTLCILSSFGSYPQSGWFNGH